MRNITTLLLCWLTATVLSAQPLCRITQYDEEDGVPSNRVTQLLQDERGFMWFSTWNGLCRYDGYDFQTFKPQVGDGCHMTTDRIRNIGMRSDGNILCRVDDGVFYLFDTKTYQFRDLTAEEQQRAADEALKSRKSVWMLDEGRFSWTDSYQTPWTLFADGRLTSGDRQGAQLASHPTVALNNPSYAFTDQQSNLWVLDNSRITRISTDLSRTQRLDITPATQVKTIFRDQQGRIWMTTRQDAAVRLYSPSLELQGFLGSDGLLHKQYTTFQSPIYCIYQSKDGTLFLASKPGGLFRMKETSPGRFHIDHLTSLTAKEVYYLQEDRYGRLWVATMDRALCYTTEPQAAEPRFLTPKHYPKEGAKMLRQLHITPDGILVAATTDGLVASRLEQDADKMQFVLHQRQPDRAESLSSSATMDLLEGNNGSHLLISTESGGVNSIATSELLNAEAHFQHINAQHHQLPNDIALTLARMDDGRLMVVSSHLVSLTDKEGHLRVLDSHYFNSDYRFSEVRPLLLADGRWLFALNDGAFVTTLHDMHRKAYQPRLVLTYSEVRGERQEVRSNWAIENHDTLTLQPGERNAIIHFAALDYQAPERISYAFRLLESAEDSTEYNYIGHNRSATLLDLEPGEYLLQIRCTNADGEWLPQMRQLTIIVEPTFWESTLGQVLIVLIIIAILAAIACTLLYIRRIKRQQRETLEKYLALIENRGQRLEVREKDETSNPILNSPRNATLSKREFSILNSQLDPMLQRVMQFVEENIGNSDVGVGDMAEAAATSRSGLQRKLKQTMGITPQDLMKEARIKRACQLLRESDKNISEVAYACGFTDPKYFSRSFRQSTGKTPSEYREE